MEFHVNHPILFILAGLLVAVVLGQSVYFLVKALRRSKALGMDQKKIRKTITTAAVFTIAPADGSYKGNFGTEEFEEFFKSFLRPQLVEMLFNK